MKTARWSRDQLQAIVTNHQYAKVDGVRVDASSAKAGLLVLDALNDDNKAKATSLPVEKFLAFAWKSVS